MATPKQFTEKDGAAVDPFAVDFFGGTAAAAEDDEMPTGEETPRARRLSASKKSDWHRVLPRVSNREAELSNLVGGLPENLTGEVAAAIAATLARYTFLSPEAVKCSVMSVKETGLAEAFERQNAAPQVFLSVSCQPENAPAAAAIPAGFAVALIERILGGKEAKVGSLRELSPIETTIVEFLAANVLSSINEYVGEPLLCLQNVGRETAFEKFERGAEVIFEIELAGSKSTFALLASKLFLTQIDRARKPLIVKSARGKSLGEAEKLIAALDLRLQIGTTFVDGDSLSFLETDDIVLIEQPQIDLLNANFSERAEIRVGRGGGFRLRGAIEDGEELNFRISEIISEETRRTLTPAKFKMDELEMDAATEQDGAETDEPAEELIAPSLENVQVALRVEIAGSKISLRELQTLRAGQIIALGVSPNDTVRLVTDGSDDPVAAGELVEIEGQLGVRLTKVFI